MPYIDVSLGYRSHNTEVDGWSRFSYKADEWNDYWVTCSERSTNGEIDIIFEGYGSEQPESGYTNGFSINK
jgi:hypothetical protein